MATGTAKTNPKTAADQRGPQKRAVELDVLRGAAALAVIVLHASGVPLTEEATAGQASWTLLVPNVVTRFAVPVFMVLSGMGLTLSAHSDEGYAKFLQRRLKSLVPEYVIWTLLYEWLMPKQAWSLGILLEDLLTGHACRHLYFVPAVVRLYILYPALRAIASKTWGVAACCLISWSMIWLSDPLTSNAVGKLLDELLPLNWIGYFTLGIWLANARKTNERAPNRTKALAPAVAILTLAALLVIVHTTIEQAKDIEVALGAAEPLILPYSISVLLTAFTAFANRKPIRFLQLVSDHSYAIYLSHMLMLQAAALILQAFTPKPTHLLQLATGLLLGIPLAIATALITDSLKHRLQRPQRAPT